MTQAITNPPEAKPPRRHDLDAIRIGAFGLLILYHLGMFYVPWDWHVDSRRPIEALQPLMWFTNPWRLTLLFLVSGAATRLLLQAYQRQGPGAAERLGGSRLLRLGLPLIFGMLVIVPPQTYYEVVQHVRNQALFSDLYNNPMTADFWVRYVTASGQWCGSDGCVITPTWNHLWFVAYVLAYGLLTALFAGWAGPRLQTVDGWFERALSGWGLFIWPLAYLVVIRIGLFPHFPVTHDFIADVYTHALSLGADVFGFLLVGAPRVTQTLVRHRHIFLSLALVSYGAFVIYMSAGEVRPPPSETLKTVMRAVYALDQWAFIAAILGYAAHYVRRANPVMTYLSGGIFTYYILHQTVIVVAAAHVEALKLPLAVEAGVITLITIAACAIGYELARRMGPAGLLVGATPRGSNASLTRHSVVIPPSSDSARSPA